MLCRLTHLEAYGKMWIWSLDAGYINVKGIVGVYSSPPNLTKVKLFIIFFYCMQLIWNIGIIELAAVLSEISSIRVLKDNQIKFMKRLKVDIKEHTVFLVPRVISEKHTLGIDLTQCKLVTIKCFKNMECMDCWWIVIHDFFYKKR